MKSLVIGLSLCAVACAHRQPKQHTTVSAVGNDAHEEQAMHGHLHRGDAPAASLPEQQGASGRAQASASEAEKCGLNVYFGTASAELTQQTKRQLEAVANCLKHEHHPDDALLVGSADPRGKEQDNAALGEERARRVAKYLRELGVPDGEIRIRSLGESQASAAPETYPSSRKVEVKTQ